MARANVISVLMFMALLAVGSGVSFAAWPSLNPLIDALEHHSEFSSDVKVEFWLPSASEAVNYDVRLAGRTTSGDTLAPAAYLIDWTLHRQSGDSQGFSAYFDGHHYRFNNQRLQEYHYARTPEVFAPNGRVVDGVQQRAQFVELLPQWLLADLRRMTADTTYSYTLAHKQGQYDIEGTQDIAGQTVREFRYRFDADGLPELLEITTNPGQITEQTMVMTYDYSREGTAVPADEDALIALYPEQFGRYRQNAFRLENLPGRRLPEFSSPSLDGQRYTHHFVDRFDAPTLIVVADTGVGSTPRLLDAIREACAMYPGRLDVILAFVDNRSEAVAEAVTGRIDPRTMVLVGARALARDCGVTDTPVVIGCDADGTVAGYVAGMNNLLVDEVITMSAGLKN